MAIPAGGAPLVIVGYMFSGLGMGIASPALFAAVLADKVEGRESQATSTIPLTRQVGSGWARRSPASSLRRPVGAPIDASEHVGATCRRWSALLARRMRR